MFSRISKMFLLCLGLLMVQLPVQAAVTVSTVAHLVAAVDEANAGGEQTILVADGTYDLNNMLHITGDSITIQGQSGNRAAVILRGQGMDGGVSHVFLVRGSHFTVRDMTIGWVHYHGIQIQGEEGASHVTVSNVRIVDCYEQLIKVSYNPASSNSSSHGLVEDSLLEYTAGIGPQYYIGGIDAHRSHNWIIRNNIFKNIASPADSPAEHAIHFWSGSEDTLVEGNLIIDCDRGIGFGMGGRGHVRGVIRNNMIYHSTRNSAYADVGIDLQSCTDVSVYNNTIFSQHDYPNAIEYRFAATTGAFIANNLTNKAIVARDGATATVTHNVTSAAADWFVDPLEADLHLAVADPAVLDQGTDAFPGLPSPFLDFDGEQRPAGSGIDIGADEFGADPVLSIPARPMTLSIFSGSHHGSMEATAETELSISISMEPGDMADQSGEWWIIHVTPEKKIFSLTFSPSGALAWEVGFAPIISMPLFPFSDLALFSLNLSLEGTYSFYFAVDDTPDGLLGEPFWFDALTVTVTRAQEPPPSHGGRLMPDNFVYQGAFLYPDGDEWSYSANSLAWYPHGDPAGSGDSHSGSLFTAIRDNANNDAYDEEAGNPNTFVGELTIPVPVKSASLADLPRAASIQTLMDITGGMKNNCTHTPDCIYREVDGLAYLPNVDRIAWNLRDWYNTARYDQDSLGWSKPDMSDPRGVWHIGVRGSDNDVFHNSKTSNYLFKAPQIFAAEWLEGKWLMAGGSREAGAVGGSQGPTLFALAPWEDGNPSKDAATSGESPADRADLNALPLIYYPEIIECVWGNVSTCIYPDYRAADHWNGGAWIETPAGSAIVIAGRKGLGDNCYGTYEECGNDPCKPYKGYHAYPYQPQIIFYDPEDIKAVRSGSKKPWQVLPYHVMGLEGVLYREGCAVIGSAAWNPEDGYLYVAEKDIDDGANGFWGVTAIHVWQVR